MNEKLAINEKNSMNEKKSINEVVPPYEEDKELSTDIYFIVVGIFFLLILVFSPLIFIKNNIYYKSRDINALYIDYLSLRDENLQLKRELESIYFKQHIILNK